MCEPIYYLPQYVDTQALRESIKTSTTEEDESLKAYNGKRDYYKVMADYRNLPTFDNVSAAQKTILSIKHNEYLKCQWYKFLENVPDSYGRISLYTEFKTKPPVRRKMQLTGQFYGADNKLAPIPYLPDPRQYDKICYTKSK